MSVADVLSAVSIALQTQTIKSHYKPSLSKVMPARLSRLGWGSYRLMGACQTLFY